MNDYDEHTARIERIAMHEAAARAAGRQAAIAAMGLVVVVVVLLLAGCQTTPAPMVIGSAPSTEVKVPVVQPCIDPAQIKPLPPTAMPPRSAGHPALDAGAAADVHELLKLVREQQDLLRACSTVPKEAP